MTYPLKKIYITQPWGVNKDVYSRFGFLGHNGIDYRLFDEAGNKSDKAKLFAPHDGKVIEAAYDADGYGHYLKIENSVEGSILAHLWGYNVKVGDIVKQGQEIGICDNSGWSTGSHLHWGYYRFPRNKQNGYGGTIDQTPYINKTTQNEPPTGSTSGENTSTLLETFGIKTEEELATKIREHLGISWGSENAKADEKYSGGYLGSARREVSTLKGQIARLETQITSLQLSSQGAADRANFYQASAQSLQLQVDALTKDLELSKSWTDQLSDDLEKCYQSVIDTSQQVIGEVKVAEYVVRLLKTKGEA